MVKCNGCPFLYMCRSTRIRHCDGRRFNESSNASNAKGLKELSSARITDTAFKNEVRHWDNNHFISEINGQGKFNLLVNKKMILLEECKRRGIVPPLWIRG